MSLRNSAIAALTDWDPPDGGQDTLRHAMLAFLHAREDACRRACVPGHVTASALVLDHTGAEVLLTLHPRLGRWVQLGGHCEDTDAGIVDAALREATEESGIEGLEIDPRLVAIHVHPLTCSLGVPTRHLDLQFVARAPAGAAAVISDESLDLRWFRELPDGVDDSVRNLAARARYRWSSGFRSRE